VPKQFGLTKGGTKAKSKYDTLVRAIIHINNAIDNAILCTDQSISGTETY
jgi:hypothetical protein